MKKIFVDGPVTLNLDGTSYEFRKGVGYTVEDEVADHPYLKQYIIRLEVVETEEEPTCEEADDGKSDADDC